MNKYKDNIMVLYSGGMGSFLSAYMLWEKGYNILLYFNDTKYESKELYRFLLDTVDFFHDGDERYNEMMSIVYNLPELYEDEEKRKSDLEQLGYLMNERYSMFVYDSDGRGVWDVFDDRSFIGNSLVDPCSEELKRFRSRKFIQSLQGDWDIAIGIDWTESHRFDKAKPNWKPNDLIAPLIDANVDKLEYEESVLSITGIQKSLQYSKGFAHDNCGGMCVKAGLGHFKILHKNNIKLYRWHEQKLEDAMNDIGRHPFLRKTVKGERYYVTLREYRQFLETGNLVVDGKTIIKNENLDEYEELEMGGCGCAI